MFRMLLSAFRLGCKRKGMASWMLGLIIGMVLLIAAFIIIFLITTGKLVDIGGSFGGGGASGGYG